MGNCMETLKRSKEMHEVEDNYYIEKHGNDEKVEKESVVKEKSLVSEKGGMRLKIVVTKEELEWLMIQLNNKGGKSLEEVLGEIERGREKLKLVGPWKPSLHTIMECPELDQEMDR